MKYLIILMLFCQSVFAECDWSKIKKNDDGSYLYSKDLHLCVGLLVENEKKRQEEIEALNKAITFKDLAITKSEERAEKWKQTTYALEDRYNSQAKYSVYRDWVFFGLGVLASGLSVYLAGQVYKR